MKTKLLNDAEDKAVKATKEVNELKGFTYQFSASQNKYNGSTASSNTEDAKISHNQPNRSSH